MQITITVTEDHVKRGVPQDGNHCVIAEAIRDVLPGVEVCVKQLLDYNEDGNRYSFGDERLHVDIYGYANVVLPDDWLKLANDFDEGEPLTLPPPVTIELEPCEMIVPYSEDVGDSLPF